jgi:hypothetical protein
MAKFRKKPVVVSAEQFFPDKKPWPAGVEEEMGAPCPCTDPQCDAGGPTGRHIVRTLEGNHIASPGDWIITGVKGERHPCKPDIFEATYDAVESV